MTAPVGPRSLGKTKEERPKKVENEKYVKKGERSQWGD